MFHKYRSETNMMRYIYELVSKDFSNGMMPLGSTMINAAAELMPVSWPEFVNMHPFAPKKETLGYQRIIFDLKEWLCDITGFAEILCLQFKNIIRVVVMIKRNICMESMAGMKIVPVKCDEDEILISKI